MPEHLSILDPRPVDTDWTGHSAAFRAVPERYLQQVHYLTARGSCTRDAFYFYPVSKGMPIAKAADGLLMTYA